MLGDAMKPRRVPASQVDPETGGARVEIASAIDGAVAAGLRCCFGDLCPGTGYVVAVTAARGGLALGERRP